MSAKIKALRAEIEADPAALEELRALEAKMRPLGLKVGAWHDSIFPPLSPSSKRRGSKTFPPAFMDAVCAILDTGTAGCIGEDFQTEIVAACKNADADFFRMMADAAKHVQDVPAPLSEISSHAAHVITLRKAAAIMLEKGKEPTMSKLRELVAKYLGSDHTSSPAWTEAFKDAGLRHLPLRPPAKKAARVRGKTR
jgi:hypothetical protein